MAKKCPLNSEEALLEATPLFDDMLKNYSNLISFKVKILFIN